MVQYSLSQMRSWASGSSPMMAGPATVATMAATASSSVMEVKPWPTWPSSVSTSTRQPDMAVARAAAVSATWSGTLTGVAVMRAILMAARWGFAAAPPRAGGTLHRLPALVNDAAPA